ncbi:MAG: hypothetical protein MK077_06150 [Phycisphaerales bacterium]|nr:hypothetical protein [Phycisphaerales bacterium]
MHTKLGWVVGLTCCSVAAGGEWHVDDDLVDNPNADFVTIQEAVDAAADVDTIYVYPGTYTSNADAVITLSDKYVVLLATGDADQTIIDGQNLRRGIVIEEDSDGLFMVGFTITHCQTPDTGGFENEDGAAMLASSAQVELYGCDIVSNSATGGWWSSGAIYCDDVDLVLEGCSMSANVANYGSAGIDARDSNVTCRHCDFTNHQPIDGPHGNGDVIYVDGVTPNGPANLALSHCSFTSNASTKSSLWTGLVTCHGDVECSSTEFRNNNSAGCMLRCLLETSGTFVDCVFDGNTAGATAGGMALTGNLEGDGDTPVEVNNCEFLGNQGDFAGGLYLGRVRATISGCQFQGNATEGGGGGLTVDNAHSVDISDTTFLANNGGEEFYGAGAVSFTQEDLIPSLARVEICGNRPSWRQIWGNWSNEGDTCIMTICDPIPDGRIGVHDLLTVLERYGESCEACTELQVADLNGDFVVDMLDIEALIADWGDTCAL